jgi:ABC-2 type transport system permease protein
VVSSFFGAKFGKHIEELLVSPLPSWVVVSGYVAGGVMRGLMVGLVVSAVALFFTHLPVTHPLIIACATILTSVIFSLGGFLNAMFAQNFDQVNIVPVFLLAPLIYLGGVFYSISRLPGWARHLSMVDPILYMVNAFRFGFLGVSDVDIRGAIAIMAIAAVGLFIVAVALMERGSGIRE